MENVQFQVFGSQDSNDTDIMVFVSSIGQPHESAELCIKLAAYLKKTFTNVFAWASLVLDINLAVLKDGVVTQVYKGTTDEVNNSLIDTYNLHQQIYPLLIEQRVERDISIKILRALRGSLSLVSRTENREEVKKALKGDVYKRVSVVREIKPSTVTTLATKNLTMDYYYKVLAFQYGQIIGLLEGKELYTKADIAKTYPELKDFLYRQDSDVTLLDKYQDIFLDMTEQYIPQMYITSEI